MAQYVKKYNTFDLVDGFARLLLQSVHESVFLFATVIRHCGCYTRALPGMTDVRRVLGT